ncbi:MAG: polysaccharide biosynthesis protein [Prochlorococcus sp.]|nr:polysaccharide biosynthesis protein [Prochlorococcaceae cyanobacterium ETNP18_MAG_1]
MKTHLSERAIVCTGLRPGEKLYEELLIDAESEATQHPLICRAFACCP